MLEAIGAYVDHCAANGERPTVRGYDQFQRQSDDLPAPKTILNRFRDDRGFTSWPDIVQLALDRGGTSKRAGR